MEAKDSLESLYNRVWNRKFASNPSLQLKQGVTVSTLPKGSAREAEEDQDFAIDSLRRLMRLDKASLTYENRLDYAFLQEHLLHESKKADLWWAEFPVTPYNLYWMNVYALDLFTPFSFQDKSDLDRYIQLLIEFGEAISEVCEKLQAQARKGWYVPAPALPAIITLLHSLRQSVPTKLEVSQSRLQTINSQVKLSFSSQVHQIIENRIVPSFHNLISYLESKDYQMHCPKRVGLGHFPGGEEIYRQLVRLHVTYDIEPDEIHEIGIEQVNQLTEQMRAVREKLGFHGSEASFITQLKTNGLLHATSPEEVERRYLHHIAQIEPCIRDYFATLPKSLYQVKRLDSAFEAGVAYGYFDPPSHTNPVGTYYYNGSGLESRSQLNAATLIFHELIPGHHLQLAIQHENDQLHPLRRQSMDLTGYIEGWAEYGAGLPKEMGLYQNPYDLYGRLIHERFMAQRLVVDTGMNVLGWSLSQAREYMAKTTIESTEQIHSETLRYSTESPAQALAYRLGYLKFIELREKAEKSLGAQFQIKQYHDAILSTGSLPLTVLEEHVNHFIGKSLSEQR